MSRSLDFTVKRMSNPDVSHYSKSDWSNAFELPSEEFFDKYINGGRKFKVTGSGEPTGVNVFLKFDKDGDFQYCATKSGKCDGTLALIEDLKYSLMSRVCCAQTVCKSLLPVKAGETVEYTIGNFVILAEECEPPDEEKWWLTERFIIALPLRTIIKDR